MLKGFSEVYDIKILFSETSYASPDDFVEKLFDNVFEKITMRMSFSNALILSFAEEHSCSKFVTWNVKHFEGRTDIPVKTPEEILNL